MNLQLTMVYLIHIFKGNKSTDNISYLQVFPCTVYHYQSVVATYAFNIISHIIQELIHIIIIQLPVDLAIDCPAVASTLSMKPVEYVIS